MFYRYSLTVPACTPATAPTSTIMYLAYGIIHHVALSFPPGCASLVHASIWRLEHQLWPTNPDQQFAWDNFTIVNRNESFPLVTRPYRLTLRAWTEDDTFSHKIVCRIGLRLPEPHRPGSWVARLLRGQ